MVPLGFMVSLSDHVLLGVPGTQFRELLLFDGDLDRLTPDIMDSLKADARVPIGYVHAQEFFTFDGAQYLVDLSSDDASFRRACVELIERTRDAAESLGCRGVVIHPGGVRDRIENHVRLLANLKLSLMELGSDRLLLENMPWYYWHRPHGRMVSNVCVSLEDLAAVRDLVDGFTLDTSHGYLSKEAGDPSYLPRFVETFRDEVKHVHASDARAPDKEGLQIGDGEIDFSFMKGLDIPTVVEIWRGHENGGYGFMTAVERFRKIEAKW
ncbi:MAG: TIM barrel protein [Thermoplasmata archaeon]